MYFSTLLGATIYPASCLLPGNVTYCVYSFEKTKIKQNGENGLVCLTWLSHSKMWNSIRTSQRVSNHVLFWQHTFNVYFGWIPIRRLTATPAACTSLKSPVGVLIFDCWFWGVFLNTIAWTRLSCSCFNIFWLAHQLSKIWNSSTQMSPTLYFFYLKYLFILASCRISDLSNKRQASNGQCFGR